MMSKYKVKIKRARNFSIGDNVDASLGHHSKKYKQKACETLDARTREQARIDCENILMPIDLEKPVVPVSLQIASEPVQVSSDFDQEGYFHRRKDFVKLYENPQGNFDEIEMFQYPKRKALRDAETLYQAEDERKKYVARTGNIIGVTGQPGIGKTTSMKKWVNQILDGNLLEKVTFLFLIFVRNIDFSTKMNLFELLVSTVLADWKHSVKTDRKHLKKILKDPNVLIALEGFDEAAVEDLKIRAPKVNLYEKVDPLVLLLNLIGGNLLPLARIVITSRPDQLYHLHSDHRPKFIVQILGLDRQSQDELGRQICLDRYEQIKGIMLKNIDAFAYCYVPINFILTLFFLLRYSGDVDFVCMTQVLSSACEQYSCGEPLKNKECKLDKLCQLAWNGYRKLKIIFKQADFKEANLDDHTIHSFLNTSVLESTNIKMTIMAGHKRSYFSHLIWQEFFSAMHLMLFSCDEEFDQTLFHLFEDRWEAVTKFLFGLCNADAYGRLARVIPSHCLNMWKRRKDKLLKVATTYLTEEYGQQQATLDDYSGEKCRIMLHLCSWVHEANDKDMTQTIAAHFPDRIKVSGTILPSDISNLFHVLRASHATLSVKDCKFTGDALTRFWKEVVTSDIRIQRFELSSEKINEDDFSSVAESLQHIEELVFFECNINQSLVAALAEKWMETKSNIRLINLGSNQIGDEGFSSLFKCLQNIQKLILVHCGISSTVCAKFAETLVEHGYTIQHLNLSSNQIGDEGFLCLLNCLENIGILQLMGCGISCNGCAKFAEKMLETGHKMQCLDLTGNGIGDEGIIFLLSCLQNIRQLTVSYCDITSAGCAKTANKLIESGHELELLSLNGNQLIGDKGARLLIPCLHLIKKLDFYNCSVTQAVMEEMKSELKRLDLNEDRVAF